MIDPKLLSYPEDVIKRLTLAHSSALERISEMEQQQVKLKELLGDVEMMICDHISCDVVMEGPRPYMRKKQELTNRLHQLGIKLAAIRGE